MSYEVSIIASVTNEQSSAWPFQSEEDVISICEGIHTSLKSRVAVIESLLPDCFCANTVKVRAYYYYYYYYFFFKSSKKNNFLLGLGGWLPWLCFVCNGRVLGSSLLDLPKCRVLRSMDKAIQVKGESA